MGTVSIKQKGDTYQLNWTLPHDKQSGIGILDGDTLSVAWTARGSLGIVVYRLRNNGNTLLGRWAQVAGGGRTYRETLSRKLDPKANPSLVGGKRIEGRG